MEDRGVKMEIKRRKITDVEKATLLRIEAAEITFDLFVDLFGTKMKKENGKAVRISSRFETTDSMILEANEYLNKSKIETTVGRFIFNKLIVERDLIDILGYINEPLTDKTVGKIDGKLSKALLSDKIGIDIFVKYLNRLQWLSMQGHTVIAGSYTMGILKPDKQMTKERDKLLKENKAKLDAGDLITAVKVEQAALEVAAKNIAGDAGMDLFNSGARGSIGNNYKNISVMKGPVFNPNTGGFDIVRSNLMEGIKKEEIPIYGNAIVTGAYPKAVGTAVAGYFSKQLIAALQAVVTDVPGSDCKTTLTVKHLITADKKGDFMFRYINDGGKLVLLDDDMIEKYVGKNVNLRSPMTCKGKTLCSKCVGEMYYMLGVRNIGMTSSRASATILNMNMKKFHDGTAKTYQLDKADMFL